ncbi:MAG: hypothetical protein WBI41_01545 [Azovibrio sp.]|uniref:hypothetical protein n=1 Tax=Azovibrio sp. TaxID=1872673 RepID=UPI003C774840
MTRRLLLNGLEALPQGLYLRGDGILAVQGWLESSPEEVGRSLLPVLDQAARAS